MKDLMGLMKQAKEMQKNEFTFLGQAK